MKILRKGEELVLRHEWFSLGGTALNLYTTQGEPVARCNVYVDGLASNEVAIKDYSENVGMLALLIEQRVVNPPHRYIQSGHVELPVCTLVAGNA